MFRKEVVIKESSLDREINEDDILWSNSIYTKKNTKRYEVTLGKKLYCYFQVEDCNLYINVYFHLLHIIKAGFIINEICEYLFRTYKDSFKVSTYLLSGNRFGMYILNKSDFKQEVVLREEYMIKGKKHDLFIMSRFNESRINEVV